MFSSEEDIDAAKILLHLVQIQVSVWKIRKEYWGISCFLSLSKMHQACGCVRVVVLLRNELSYVYVNLLMAPKIRINYYMQSVIRHT